MCKEGVNMSIRGKSEKTQIEIKPHVYEQINPQLNRVKAIYDRYHTGKSIIMDDLQYLWSKDPEGCVKLARSIIDSKIDKGLEIESGNMISYVDSIKYTESTDEQVNCIDHKTSIDTPMDTLKNVHEIMASVKLMVEKMSENELLDMLKNLNEELELKKLNNNMKYWDDTFVDKMVMYTYDVEKEFNSLA